MFLFSKRPEGGDNVLILGGYTMISNPSPTLRPMALQRHWHTLIDVARPDLGPRHFQLPDTLRLATIEDHAERFREHLYELAYHRQSVHCGVGDRPDLVLTRCGMVANVADGDKLLTGQPLHHNPQSRQCPSDRDRLARLVGAWCRSGPSDQPGDIQALIEALQTFKEDQYTCAKPSRSSSPHTVSATARCAVS